MAIDPKYKDALSNKGDALNSLGKYKEAITYFDKALAIDPKYKDALSGKGQALYKLGNYSGAITYLDKALAIPPSCQCEKQHADKDALILKQISQAKH